MTLSPRRATLSMGCERLALFLHSMGPHHVCVQEDDMKWSILGAALIVAPLAFQSQMVTAKAHDTKREIALQGCVVPAEKKGTFLLTNVTELPAAGEHAMPEMAHGRRVV